MRRLFDRFVLRLRSLLRGPAVDDALRGEIELHLQEEIDELVSRGMSRRDARAAAMRSFGPVAAIEDACRDERRTGHVESLAQDLRYAVRSLSRQPMLVGAATLSIAVAIGVNTTVFTLAHEFLVADPAVRRADRLVHIRFDDSSHVTHDRWRALSESGALEGLAGINFERAVNWKGPAQSIGVWPLIVTANYFDLFEPPMAQGRGFNEAEARADLNPAVAVVSYRFWQDRLAGRDDVIGSPVEINGIAYTIVGVLQKNARSVVGFALAPEVYLPVSRTLDPGLDDVGGGLVQLVGILRDGQSVDEGRAALATAAERISSTNREKRGRRISQFVRAGTTAQAGELRAVSQFFGVLLGAVGLVLAIGCANVSGLLLARATERRREMAVRVALGATRRRLVQQLLVEGLWLSLAGAAAGLVLMRILTGLIAGVALPIPVPIELNTAVGGTLLLYTLALTVATTLLSALAPAIQATRPSQVPALKSIAEGGHRRWTLRRLLVAGQFGVAALLLLTAALFVRDLTRAKALDPGFEVSRVLVAKLGFVESRHTPATGTALLESAVERVAALPGVASASYAYGAPLTIRHGMLNGTEIRVLTQKREFRALYHVNTIGPQYFSTLRIPLLQGRDFTREDRQGAPHVVIINERFARRHFASDSPLGHVITLPGRDTSYPAEIVGVVGDGKYRTLGEDPLAAVYLPYAQQSGGQRSAHLFARTIGDPESLRADVTTTIAALDPLAAIETRPMRAALAFAFMPTEISAALLGTLGALGLMLALVGMFATMSYSVSRRTAEIGIRIALGANRARVMRLVLREAGALAAAGLLVGLGTAWLAAKPLAMFFVSGLSTTDPWSFGSSAALVILVSVAAAWIPARRAMKIDPIAALRAE
jgi:predicted permease